MKYYKYQRVYLKKESQHATIHEALPNMYFPNWLVKPNWLVRTEDGKWHICKQKDLSKKKGEK